MFVQVVTHVTHSKAEQGMLSKRDVLERAFRAIEGLKARSEIAVQKDVPEAVGVSLPKADLKQSVAHRVSDVEIEVACRCSKWPFPHIHGLEDQRRAIEAWNSLL